MVNAAVILQRGKVELRAMREVPLYLLFMIPERPAWLELGDSSRFNLNLETTRLHRHRMVGLSLEFAYWPEKWLDDWAVDELLKWEGRDLIDRDRWRHEYYDQFQEANQSSSSNERTVFDPQSVSRDRPGLVSSTHESVRGWNMDDRSNVQGEVEQATVLRLERGASGRYATNLSGEDGE